MTAHTRNRCCLPRGYRLLGLVLVAFSHIAAGQQPAGSVIFATGPVGVQRGQFEPLMKGDAIQVGDLLMTGEGGRAQLLFNDGAKVAIRPNSQLRIDDFQYSEPSAQPAVAVTSAGMQRSFTTLLKGGFRTITGLIGQDDEEEYEIRTPVGTLGIRGTDYAAVFCLSDCTWAPGANPAQPPEDGLYVGVTDGLVVFRNELGEIEIEAGQFVFIPIQDRLPQLMGAPPPILLDEIDLELQVDLPPERADDLPPGTAGFDATLAARKPAPTSSAPQRPGEPEDGADDGSADPAQPTVATDADGNPVDLTAGITPQPDPRSISYSTGPLGAAPFSSTQDEAPGEYQLAADNTLIGFVGQYPGPVGPEPTTFALGTSANVESGFDRVTMMRWGRWAGGTAAITLSTGVDASQDLGTQSIHWISGPQFSTPPAMPQVGSATYSLLGATTPTDNLGNVGVIGGATFNADFLNASVTSTLNLDIAGSTWTANGAGMMGRAIPGTPDHQFTGNYGVVAIDGVANGSGVFSGFFSEPGAADPSLPGGAGLTFGLQDVNGGIQVSGAAVFGNPTRP